MPERVVFDTNIWISGLMWRGKPYQSLLLARSGIVEAVYCTSMAAELSEKLRNVFGFSEEHIRGVMYELRRISTRVEITGELRAVPEDHDDDKFVECAIAAGASLVVSGDNHLITLGEYQDVEIITPAQFVARFTRTADDPE